jgi:ribosomal protein S18 acetylase RimI-like enzyme
METLVSPVELDNPPQVAGFTFRSFRGPDDFPRMTAVLDAARPVDGFEWVDTPETLAAFFAHLDNCDPYRDMLFVERGGGVVAYNRCWWEQEENGPRIYAHRGVADPAWRGRGLGRAAVHWLEARLRAIAAEHDFAGERLFQAAAGDQEPGRMALLESEGYRPVRYGFNMVRPLTEPVEVTPLPPGLEVRPVEPEHYRAIWDADVEAFRDHWGYVPPTESGYDGWLASPLFQPERWQIAWDTTRGEVAGMVQNFVMEAENKVYQRRRGYTEGISVRRPYRRQGLARALLTRSLQNYQAQGFTEAALGVDAENPNGALGLYESVGFKVVRKLTIYRKAMGG